MTPNEQRSERAFRTMLVYAQRLGEEPEGIRDLLADLMHYCDDYNIDFSHEVMIAEMHYEAEKEEE